MRTLASLLVLALRARSASAECWLRDDGTEICSPEPLAWRIASWIWFAVLVLVFALVCGWDAVRCCCCCCCCKRKKPNKLLKPSDGDDASRAIRHDALTEPLLPPIVGKGSAGRLPKYRYLDP